jgi:hypothetical protein
MKKPAPKHNTRRTSDAEVEIRSCKPIHRTARSAAAMIEDNEPPPAPRDPGVIDAGIRKAVKCLQENGIETFESCEGGPGHAYPEPTVAFHGTPEAGWRGLGVCLAYGLPIQSLRRVWHILDGDEPNGPYWEVTFRKRMP